MARFGWMTGTMSAVVLAALVGRAEAQEYCVSCSEPNAVYRCVIEGARPGGGQSLQLLCVTSMAKDGGHATCSVKRGTVFECDGPMKRVPWASIEAPAQAKDTDPAATKPDASAAKTEPDPNEPPKTVVDMAKRANEQTAEQMKKAGENVKQTVKTTGEAIGTATKKTWDCLFSLFKQC
jgi:hypothetical protein